MVHVRSQVLVPAIVVGVAAGAVGVAYLAALHLVTELIGPGAHGAMAQAVALVGAGAVVALGARLLGPTGNVELLVDNIHVLGGVEGVRETRSMVPVSLVCVAAGGAMGPEAPLVQTTGTLGTWLAERFRLDRDDVRILTITGMAAGFTVLFGAPLGAALFALEILHRRGLQYYEAIMPAVIGSLAGLIVAAAALQIGLEPVWTFPEVGPVTSTDLAWALAIGVLGALGARLFVALANLGRRGMDVLPPWARPVLGGAILAALGALSPYALTFGEAQIGDLVVGRLTIGALAVAAVAKLAGTITTLVSGWKGGFIIPLFFLGVACGEIVHLVAPSANEAVVVSALMVALCVGVTKTPLGSTLVVTEMAGLVLLPTTLVAAVVALLLSGRHGLIDSQRDRDPVPGPELEVGG
jgi:H+/Cl- antiporter ClcA